MKILNKFLLTFLLFVSTNLLADESQFISGANNSDGCESKCPPLKAGFIGRIADFNIETGTTTCYVYSLQDLQNPMAKVVNQNNNCGNKVLSGAEKVSQVNSNSSTVNSHLINLKGRMDGLYNDTGAVKYLDLPKYMVAGLMADDKVIDIASSITTNELVLNGGYSNAPNIVSSDHQNPQLISRTKDALSNSVTFLINFMSLSDKSLLSLKVLLFLFVSAVSISLALSQKATKKISKIADHDDIVEKVLFGVGSILVFFLTVNKIPTPDGQISQTAYQQMIRPFMYQGINIANKMTENATTALLKYKFAGVGINVTDDFQALKDIQKKEEIKNKFYTAQLNECKSIYNTDATSHYVSLLNANTLFPPSEVISTKGIGIDEKRQINFYTKMFFNNEANLKNTDVPAISYCYQIERAYYESNSYLKSLNKKVTNYNSSMNTKMETKINQMVDLTYKNIQDFGFVSVINLGTTIMAFDTFSLMGSAENDNNYQENYEMKLEDYRNQTGYEIQGFAKPENDGTGVGIINSAINDVLINAPIYAMMPFTKGVQDYVNMGFKPLKTTADTMLSGIEMVIGKIPLAGGMLSEMIHKVGSASIEFTLDALNHMFTMYIIKTIGYSLPLIAIIGAGLLSVTFYFLSISILYIVIPFASIFAFSTGNLEIIKTLIKHTFILMVKPVLIVVSIVLATFVYSMINSLFNVIVSNIFEPIFLIANNTDALDFSWESLALGVQGIGAGATFVLLKGVFAVVLVFLNTLVTFYFAFKGGEFILDFLGIRESGFDIQGKIGDTVSNSKGVSSITTPFVK